MRRVPFAVWLLGAGLSVSLLISLAAQSQEPPTFHGSVDLLQIDVSALDSKRLPVVGLTQDQFVVRVDGRTVPIVAFQPVTVPDRASVTRESAWLDAVSPDVVSNRLDSEGRAVVILFDRTIAPVQMPTARKIARAAVASLGAGDVVAITYVGHARPQDFTSDRARLSRTIDQTFTGLPEDDPGDDHDESCHCGTCTLDALTTIAEALSQGVQRRKTVLFIGSWISFQRGGFCATDAKDARNRLYSALDRSGITVHTIDPTGLKTLAGQAQTTGTPGGAVHLQVTSRQQVRQLELGSLPERTGGRLITDTNDPDLFVPAVMAESRSYYMIGIDRPAPRADNRDTRIEVRVRRSGVNVASRRSYGPDSPSSSSPVGSPAPPGSLVADLAGAWPARGLVLDGALAPFASRGGTDASVIVVATGHESGGSASPRDIGMAVGAFDMDGRALALQQERAAVTPPSRGDWQYEIGSRLALAPGHYGLRLAVKDGDLAGSLHSDVDVPDFQRAPVSLSGVLVGTASPAHISAALAALLPFAPTARRDFARGEPVLLFVRAYVGEGEPIGDVALTSRIYDAQRTQLFEDQVAVKGTELVSRSTDYRADLPTSLLPSGEFLLTIDANAAGHSIQRVVRFRIR